MLGGGTKAIAWAPSLSAAATPAEICMASSLTWESSALTSRLFKFLLDRKNRIHILRGPRVC